VAPSVAAVAAAAAASGAVWLGGGEPTLRADLPALLDATSAHGVGLDTDGLALSTARVAASLQARGLTRVRIALHAGRADAHDWLVGLPGAARRARKAIEACATAGLEVHGAVTLTRPTMDLLPETVGLLLRLGATHVRLRRVRRRGPAAAAFITLSPRLGLLEPFLEEAIQRALDGGATVSLDGLPRCAAPRAPAGVFAARERVVLPAGAGMAALFALLADPPAGPPCPACPGGPTCPGAPADYLAAFGRAELDSEVDLPPVRPIARPRARGALPEAPPPRAGRAPATRLRAARRAVRLGDLGGDPLGGTRAAPVRAAVTVTFDRARTSRDLRQALVRGAQQGAAVLVVAGDLTHPDAPELLREALRLSAPRVEVHADPTPLSAWSDRQLFGLRRLARLVAPRGLGDRPEAVAAAARLTDAAGVAVDFGAGGGAADDSRPPRS